MVKRIVLTGGPGSGKTTVINGIKEKFESQGIKVIVVAETATELINSGIKPFGENPISLLDFQELILKQQLAKEEVVDRAIKLSGTKDTLVIYDRGAIDNRAYVNEDEFDDILSRFDGLSISNLMNRYDAVINLVGRKDFYTLENNAARSESVNEALELGDITLNAWMGHNNIKIVMPKDTVLDKINEVINIINDIFSKEQVKRQEKYIVNLSSSNLDEILNISKCKSIIQVYLESNEDEEKRIRRVSFNGSVYYKYDVYKIKDDKKILISSKEINEKMFNTLLEFKDNDYEVINKNRYYFNENGKYYYLDIFNGNDDIGLLEINVYEDERKILPSNLDIIDRVTNNQDYYNKNIAKKDKLVKELKK